MQRMYTTCTHRHTHTNTHTHTHTHTDQQLADGTRVSSTDTPEHVQRPDKTRWTQELNLHENRLLLHPKTNQDALCFVTVTERNLRITLRLSSPFPLGALLLVWISSVTRGDPSPNNLLDWNHGQIDQSSRESHGDNGRHWRHVVGPFFPSAVFKIFFALLTRLESVF